MQKELTVEGQTCTIKVMVNPTGKAFIVDIQSKQMLNPMLIEMALYDVAAMIAHQHGIVETMLKIKGDAWS